ncbi:hypothetical protein TSOC_009807 [Tetrabaena socialis]|uniref:Uncharacterized protein n=1 Tax=Tetrabaena socialis TaxID=47790 RepID=A0A2J7ZUW6_9CHLO|nr:hypothetical protein TSOC_009807 [Tetrabaena socialis]|eukprot:PNH04071.1 hypothetical protein TSOC_009807 [Tetrabaena socialis]
MAAGPRALRRVRQLLPPAALLALQPQRTLALLGRLLQQAHELRRPGARQGGRGGGGRGMGAGAEETEPTHLAGEVARALVHMAADEQLVGAVAGWLRGEVVEGEQQQLQPLRGGLDARALAAALQLWDGAAADEVISLYAAAATGAPRDKAGEEGGGSNSRGPGAAASGGGAAAPLLFAAGAAIAQSRSRCQGVLLKGASTLDALGALLKGASALDALAGCTTVALDKTGTITSGQLRLTEAALMDLGTSQEAGGAAGGGGGGAGLAAAAAAARPRGGGARCGGARGGGGAWRWRGGGQRGGEWRGGGGRGRGGGGGAVRGGAVPGLDAPGVSRGGGGGR